MKSFEYVIKDELGIHARPAGMLVKEAKNYSSQITIDNGTKKAVATKLMAVMGMGVKCGQTVVVRVEGEDEDVALDGMRNFFESNL